MKREDQLQEKNKYENASFPFEIYRADKYSMHPHGRGFENLHWHDEIQYTVAVKGSIVVQVNGQNYSLEEGSAIFINSQLLHAIKDLDDDGKYFSINFDDRILSFFRGSVMEQKYVLPYLNDFFLPVLIFTKDVPWQDEILRLIDQISFIYNRRSNFAWEYKISMLLCEIWHLILTNVQTEENVNVEHLRLQQSRIQTMLTFIHENYAEPIALNDIADMAHISVSECTRRFREYTRLSPYEYLIQYRISKASVLLLKTDYSMSHIADLTGFQNSTHFIQTFKKRIGMTPLRYRKLHQDKNSHLLP